MSPRRREAAPGPTAADALTADLRRRVLSGELAPDRPLREEDIAAATGHSRHTVRTALARLADERLAVAAPYRGVRVATFDDEAVVALQQLRAALEVEAVRLLRAAHGTRWPAMVTAPVEAAIGAMGAFEGDRAADWPGVAAAHAAVHTALVDAARSPRISEAHARLHSETLLLLVHQRPLYTVPGLVSEHRVYLAAVQRDGEPAVRAHLAASTASLLGSRGAPT